MIIHDFINLTQGQLLIKYWWLWLSILAVATFFIILEKGETKMNKKIESKNENTSFDLGTGKAEFKYAEYKSTAERISDLEKRVSAFEEVVQNLQGQIDLKVDKHQIIGTINTSTEGIFIEGEKININPKTLYTK